MTLPPEVSVKIQAPVSHGRKSFMLPPDVRSSQSPDGGSLSSTLIPLLAPGRRF
ncbi:MAG TPA: hypothetical protein VM123_18350 [archaeon]|nr:hypothetical protein [archaeon]